MYRCRIQNPYSKFLPRSHRNILHPFFRIAISSSSVYSLPLIFERNLMSNTVFVYVVCPHTVPSFVHHLSIHHFYEYFCIVELADKTYTTPKQHSSTFFSSRCFVVFMKCMPFSRDALSHVYCKSRFCHNIASENSQLRRLSAHTCTSHRLSMPERIRNFGELCRKFILFAETLCDQKQEESLEHMSKCQSAGQTF